MKTNYYILLALLLSFSFASAQSNVEEKTVEPTVMISETVQETSVNAVEVIENENTEVKEDLARTNSDIKIYLNRLRNEGNINLLFPKINKVQTA
ncbi:hypothetical protein KO566_10055 [Flavobacteriaceae bacterium XHP0103]|uniref:hypothetical protein n=1 Tax=Marixanthotalea marina TaxID=2844359 RepID=UPI002989DE5E|nr:hypothetical protein [Marixanthotalea marina]MBU3822404.1 hypothetical protein [Marixanthotalea marina]